MQVFNTPNSLIETLKKPILNESFSRINFEPSDGEIDVSNSFAAFINDGASIISLLKAVSALNCTVVVFDSSAKLAIHGHFLLVGIQDLSEEMYQILRSKSSKFYPMKEISIDGKEEVCDAVMSVCKDSKRLHLHIDESVLNSTGLTPRELLYFIQRLRLLKAIKSISLNIKDVNLSLKLMSELF